MHPFRLAVPLLLLACSVTEASAQQVAVRGTVRDSASNEPIPFAVVEIAGSARRFTANDRGTYSIDELAEGRWRLVAHAPGYSSAEAVVVVTADDLADIELDFVLRVGAFELEGILVQGARAPRPVAEAPIGAPPQVIDEARISAVPVAFEPDVLRVVQTLPSVAAASDFSSALYVRGATPDQTVVLLDGTPIFNPYHFAGLFSAIDVGLVDNVTAHVGPTTAALGDRLAATIEIESKAPPIVSTRGWGNVGLVSTNAGVAGPLADGGYTVAARHTYIDLITGAAHELGLMKFAFPYGFTDLYGHVRHPLVGGELRVSGYYNNEHVSPPGEEVPGLELEFDWGTGAASAIWEGILGPSVSMRGGVGFSSFTGEFLGRETDVDRPPFIDATLINRMVRPSVDFLWLAGGQDVRFGAAAELYEFGYRMSTTEEGFDIIFPELDTSSSLATVSAHVEMEWSSGVDTQWRVGLRALAANGAGLALMPRIGWSRDVGAHWSIFAAAGRKAQAVRSMRSEEAVTSSLFAYDVLAPADRLAVGDELAAGFEWRPRPTTTVRVEAYGRRAYDVPVTPLPDNVYFTPLLVPHETVVAEDDAAGVEVSASHRFRDTELWLSYSGAWLRRTIGDESFTPRFHRAHHLQLLATQSMWARTALSTSIQLGSGQPYSQAIAWSAPLRYDVATGTWNFEGEGILLEQRNESRLPMYFRLDLSLRSSFTPRLFGRDVTIAPYLSVLNAIAYSNSAFTIYDIGFGSIDGNAIGETHAPQMPLLPTVGMEWRF